MLRRTSLALAAAFLWSAAPAAAKDYAPDALNIIPSGQYGSVPIPAGADQQALMYDGLTPLFDQVTAPDLTKYFKSEALGAAGSPAPTHVESTPRKGLTLVRDAFNVPHITGKTRDDVTWGAGWVLEEDRGAAARPGPLPGAHGRARRPGHRRLLARHGPQAGDRDQAGRQDHRQGPDRRAQEARQGGARDAPRHRRLRAGHQRALKFEKSSQKPWTRVDVYSINALAGQIFGQGGGDEVRRSQLLDALNKRLGATQGKTVFNDLSEHMDQDTPLTIQKNFPYEQIPSSSAGNAVIDDGSTNAKTKRALADSAKRRRYASNFLMVSAKRSATGHPLFVAGPQIGYFYPGLTLEMDLKGPGIEARGAAMPGGPGDILIGRGQDHAWSLTSAGSDTNDQFVETLCGGSDFKYMYKGKCRKMGSERRHDRRRRRRPGEVPHHRPRPGPGLRDVGRQARGDLVQALELRQGHPLAADVQAAVDRPGERPEVVLRGGGHVAVHVQRRVRGRQEHRHVLGGPAADPRQARGPAPAHEGHGQVRVEGLPHANGHPHEANPASGKLVNWNNKPAAGFGSSDSEWSYGSIHRVQMLKAGIDAKPTHDLASVVSAMNKAATQDLRDTGSFLDALTGVLDTGPPPSARAAQMEALLKAWRATGSSRLDRDLDGKMDAGAAPAIMDAIYPKVADAALAPCSDRSWTSSRTSRATTSAAATPEAGSTSSTRTCAS